MEPREGGKITFLGTYPQREGRLSVRKIGEKVGASFTTTWFPETRRENSPHLLFQARIQEFTQGDDFEKGKLYKKG